MSHKRRRAWSVALICAAGLLVSGCGADHPGAAAGGPDHRRIVSLAPALTQMVCDLGMRDRLVAVAEHDAPAADLHLPVVGTFVDIHAERLLSVDPTDVLLCYGKAGPPPRLVGMARGGGFTLTSFAYPKTIADVANLLANHDPHTPAMPSLGKALGVPDKARALRQRLLDHLAALKKLTADRPTPRVLLVFSTSPVMASGPGSVNDELLGYVGATNAAAGAAVSAPTYDHEALVALKPDVILLLMPGAPPLGENDQRLAGLKSLPIPAAKHHDIVLLNDPLVLLPSSSLDRIAAEMAQAIHPGLSDQINAIVPLPERAKGPRGQGAGGEDKDQSVHDGKHSAPSNTP